MSLAFLLTACVGSTPSVEAGNTSPVLQLASPKAQLDPKLKADCAEPAQLVPDLPDGRLSQGAVERAWGSDRVNLSQCRSRHAEAIRFYDARDASLAGRK